MRACMRACVCVCVCVASTMAVLRLTTGIDGGWERENQCVCVCVCVCVWKKTPHVDSSLALNWLVLAGGKGRRRSRSPRVSTEWLVSG